MRPQNRWGNSRRTSDFTGCAFVWELLRTLVSWHQMTLPQCRLAVVITKQNMSWLQWLFLGRNRVIINSILLITPSVTICIFTTNCPGHAQDCGISLAVKDIYAAIMQGTRSDRNIGFLSWCRDSQYLVQHQWELSAFWIIIKQHGDRQCIWVDL